MNQNSYATSSSMMEPGASVWLGKTSWWNSYPGKKNKLRIVYQVGFAVSSWYSEECSWFADPNQDFLQVGWNIPIERRIFSEQPCLISTMNTKEVLIRVWKATVLLFLTLVLNRTHLLSKMTVSIMNTFEYNKKALRVGESNPGRPRDRREYSPLY